MNFEPITKWCHHFIQNQVSPGDICIDATAGNGHDTVLLCHLVGSQGKVYAFDIQQQAIAHTRARLEEEKVPCFYELILDSHVHMDQYIASNTVSCITFNFGYLPGGNHTICTKADSSLKAIQKGLLLLKQEGLMTLCIYSGKDTGFMERETLLSYLKTLDCKKFFVVLSQYYNRPNHPPVLALVRKL